MHDPEELRKLLKDEVLIIIEEAEKDVINGLRRHVQIHKLSVNEVSIEELLSWVRSSRVLKREQVKIKVKT